MIQEAHSRPCVSIGDKALLLTNVQRSAAHDLLFPTSVGC